jgi:hypothetical protein
VVDLERRARLQTVGTVLGLVVLVGAGGWLLGMVIAADDNSQSEAAATTTTAPPDPDAAVKAEIEDAYRAYNAMVERLALAPDPEDPELPQRATGRALDRIIELMKDLVASGDVGRLGPTRSQTILTIEVTADTATLRACLVDESGRYDAATGEAIVPMMVGTIIDTATLERSDGTWRVSAIKNPGPDERWEGVSTCGV